MHRRVFLQSGALIAAAWSGAGAVTSLSVAYAGSMGALMDQGISPVWRRDFHVRLEGRAQGALGLAHLIVANVIRPDVFISITREPMDVVLRAGYAAEAVAIASTELVIAYNPRARARDLFARTPWWRVLETPGVRFGRTDPRTDPQGLNVIFMMKLAERFYGQPGLAHRVLGPWTNGRQIFPEPEVMARLQAGELDASSAYKTEPAALGLPFVTLPAAVNLGDAAYARSYAKVSVDLNGQIHHPSPLVFYAAILNGSPRPRVARTFIHWLRSAAGQAILRRFHYDGPGTAPPLR
ncbi:MAG: extracellular solute-binding protein [Gammaproteobacteria bacterium]|nr:extracellular solute-binding protein [Gammaproteobacteria bacterium]